AGDLPRSRGMNFFGGNEFFPGMPAMPPMPPMPRGTLRTMLDGDPIHLELGPELGESLEGVRMELDRLRPELEAVRASVPRMLERVKVPEVRVRVGRERGVTI
ncbi:MAG TPA: hypothetical protein VKA54_19545, partial [Gemmatimonadaceae bacterium]|nr:hypothetical protein [Gemmatimonadaceae bacterium]